MVYTRLVAYVNRRGLNRSSRERERDDFRHSVDGHFTQRAYIGEWTRTRSGRVPPRATTMYAASGNVSILNMYASIRRRLLRTRFNV